MAVAESETDGALPAEIVTFGSIGEPVGKKFPRPRPPWVFTV